MAIKISGDTIINDSRVVENADRIGIGTTNPYVALEVSSGDVGIGTTNPTASNIKTSLQNNTNVLAVGIVTANEYYGTFKGTIDDDVATDKADTINITDDTSDSGTHYVHFGSQTSGYDGVEVDSTGLVYKDGKFGVGTNSPAEKLDIRGKAFISDSGGDILSLESTAATSRTTLKLYTNGNDWELGARGSSGSPDNSFYIYDMASTAYRLVIDPSGNLGIGLNNPQGTVHISSRTSGDATLILEADTDNNNEEDNPYIVFRQDGGINASAIGHGVDYVGAGGHNGITIANSITNGFISFATGSTNGYTNATEKLRITSNGSVGIGTNNPNHELTIWADEPNIRLTHCKPDGSNNSLNAFYALVNSEGVVFNSYQDVSATKRPFIFKQYNVERLRITDTGHLKPGATDTYDLGTDANNRFRTVYAQTFNGAFQGTADVAAKVSVADESTDTTCFPLFVTAATGDLAAKSGSNLTFNSDTGQLTATSFVGALPITNDANNRIITSTGSGGLNAETNLTFNGTDLTIPSKIKHRGDGDTLIEFGTDTITFDTAGGERLRIDSNGNIGVNATPVTSGGAGTLYGTVDHFLVIGDSDTGIAQDGDGEFEIWANNVEIINFSTAGIDPKKSIIPSGSINIGSSSDKINHGYFTTITADNITAELTGSASLLDVADDTTDTDGYLLFSNDTGADQSIKTNTNIRYDAVAGTLELRKTDGGITFGPGTAANDRAHIEWKGSANAGYLRISTDDDQDAVTTAEYIEFGDYASGDRGGTFTQHVKIARSEFLVRTGSNSISPADRLKIDSNGNIGVNATPKTTGTLYSTVDHFLVIGDSDTGIAQDGDGQFEIWANNQEIVNFNTSQITPTKSIIPSVTDGSLDLGSTNNRWGTIYANTINGTITGTITNATDAVNAENVKVTQRDTAGAHYLTFVSSNPTGTNLPLYGDNDLQFNPSTNRLSAAQMKPGGIVDSSDGTGTANYVIKADGSGGWSWGQVTGGTGVDLSFLGLSDTPSSFTANKTVKVNSSGNALIFADDTTGLTNVEVKQYSDNDPTRTERTCKEPIGVVVSSGTATIGIGTTSNAYGAKYVQSSDPTTSGGGSYTVCEGDIWYDTTESTENTGDTTSDIIEATKFFQNPTSLTVTSTFPVSGTKNGGVFGPYTIGNGVVLTINSGSTFTIL
tara:strand:+ start:263 stop:3781 length:3519 start_codon:yes stop_codon:yes gene_type:complete